MKKIKNTIIIALSFVLLFSLIGCSKNDAPSQSIEPQPVSESTTPEQTEQSAEIIETQEVSEGPFVYEVRKIASVDEAMPETEGMAEYPIFSDYYANVNLFGDKDRIEFYYGDTVKSPVLPDMSDDVLKFEGGIVIHKSDAISFEDPDAAPYLEDFSQKLVKERENNEFYDSKQEKTVSFMESPDGTRQAVIFWSTGHPAELTCKVTQFVGVSNHEDGTYRLLMHESGFRLTGANENVDFDFFYDYCEEYLGVHFE